MIGQFDFTSIAGRLQALEPALELTLHVPGAPTEFADALRAVADALVRQSPTTVSLHVDRDSSHAVPFAAIPALTLERAGSGRVQYLALPEGPEKAPFLEAILGPGHTEREAGELRARLADMGSPAELVVFIASTCPHCPRAVQAAVRLAGAHLGIAAAVVDVEQCPELCEQFGVRSTPTSLIDRKLSWTGVRSAGEIADDLLARGGEAYEQRAFRSLIEASRFDAAVHSMHTGSGAKHFLVAWQESTMSSRIGLLMAAEAVLETSHVPFQAIVDELATMLQSDDVPLRGDTADLLGRIDHPAARAALRPLVDDPDPDIAEIAAEALGLETG